MQILALFLLALAQAHIGPPAILGDELDTRSLQCSRDSGNVTDRIAKLLARRRSFSMRSITPRRHERLSTLLLTYLSIIENRLRQESNCNQMNEYQNHTGLQRCLGFGGRYKSTFNR